MGRKGLVRVGLAGTAIWMLVAGSGSAASQSALGSHVVGPDALGRELSIGLPIQDQLTFRDEVLQLAHSARVPVGVEYVRDEPLPDSVKLVPSHPQRIGTAGKSIGELLTLLAQSAPALRTEGKALALKYTWLESGGLIHVTPFGTQKTFLDETIPSLTIKDQPALAGIFAIHQILDSGYRPYPGRVNPVSQPLAPGDRAAKNREAMDRPISISLRNVSIRQALDAIVLANGELSWSVPYVSQAGQYAGASIYIHSFYGTGTGVPARANK